MNLCGLSVRVLLLIVPVVVSVGGLTGVESAKLSLLINEMR